MLLQNFNKLYKCEVIKTKTEINFKMVKEWYLLKLYLKSLNDTINIIYVSILKIKMPIQKNTIQK